MLPACRFRLGAESEVCLLLSHALPNLVDADPDKPKYDSEGNIERALRAALTGTSTDDAVHTQFAALCEAEAKAGNVSARNNLGFCKLYGLGDKNLLAEEGGTSLVYERTERLAYGHVFCVSLFRCLAALNLFEGAAKGGSLVAANNVLICQIRGITPLSPSSAATAAAALAAPGGDAVAVSMLSSVRDRCCTIGFSGWSGGGAKPALATTPPFIFAALTALAEQKPACPGAQYNVGCALYLGVGTKPDVARAVSYFARSANSGFAPAMIALARCWSEGRGGLAVDAGKAAELYRKVKELQSGVVVRPASAITALLRSNDESEKQKQKEQKEAGAGETAASAAAAISLHTGQPYSARELEWLKEAKFVTDVTWKLAMSNDVCFVLAIGGMNESL